jgi:hypothetical protein
VDLVVVVQAHQPQQERLEQRIKVLLAVMELEELVERQEAVVVLEELEEPLLLELEFLQT